jgi:putative DNA primase/helicase
MTKIIPPTEFDEALSADEAAAEHASNIWNGAAPAPDDHLYLKKAGIKAHGLKVHEGKLVAPLYDIDGTLQSLQFINADDEECGLPNDLQPGWFCVIGKTGATSAESGLNQSGLNLIAVDFETAASCTEATDDPVVVAFDKDNLLPVALALRDRYPRARFIICGDDGDPALAKKAAAAIGAAVAFPVFDPGRDRWPEWVTFNDLHREEGVGAVRDAIDCAESAERLLEREARPINADLVEKIEAAILQYAAMSETAFEIIKREKAKDLKVDLHYLERRVRERRKANEKANATAAPDEDEEYFTPIEPWLAEVETKDLIAAYDAAIEAHVVTTPERRVAIVLFALHCHTHDANTHSPILLITSPTPMCGKSNLLEVLQHLVPKAEPVTNVKPATYRLIEAAKPTLLIDEGDSFKWDDELHNLINTGHKKAGARIPRFINGKRKLFSTWCPKVIAQITDEKKVMRATLLSRGIRIRLHKKLPEEETAHLTHDRLAHLKNLNRQAVRWSQDNMAPLRDRDVEAIRARISQKLRGNRLFDNWSPLLAIADLGGDECFDQACAAAIAIELGNAPDATQEMSVRSLADIRTVFDASGKTTLSSDEFINGICRIDENPWTDYRGRGKRITSTALAALLKPFEITSKTVTRGPDKGKKRWYRADFDDAWKRYLPSKNEKTASQAATLSTALKNKDNAHSRVSTGVKARNGKKANDFNGVDTVET